MSHPAAWNPLTEWKHQDIDWVKVEISKDDLQKFTKRNNLKGLFHAVGFLLLVAATGGCAWWAFSQQHWIVMTAALYLHGIIYGHFGDALHELGHNTVFSNRRLTVFFTTLYGLLYWVWNPHLYRISHMTYHHRYTLHQGSDGEDTPNYVKVTPWSLFQSLFFVFQFRQLAFCLYRLLTLTPTSKVWRGRGFKLDTWGQFNIQKASQADQQRIRRFTWYALISQVLFVGLCLYFKLYFLIVLVTLAPFYGAQIHSLICTTHQHTACEANCPDFRISCGDAILDPVSSFIYWHMEYHIEHHMFAAIPCYNLKAFSQFVADQLPEKEYAIPRLVKLNKICKEKYGSWQTWRDNFGRFKGL